MFRYFVKLSFDGTDFHGWQSQPAAVSVQQTIESNIFKCLKKEIRVVGCGRTDSGVHASEFFLHFDHVDSLDNSFVSRMNYMLPDSIAFKDIRLLDDQCHARYSAYERSYRYHLHGHKSPFSNKYSYRYKSMDQLDKSLLLESAALLSGFEEFFPFCKSNSDVKHYRCTGLNASWQFLNDQMIFNVKANRFLRGMVRLIIGMSLNVAMGKLDLSKVEKALQNQNRLPLDWSVPAHGLFLNKVLYPFIS